MDLNIVSRHVNVTPTIEEHIREQFSKLDKYFAGIQHVDIVMHVDGHGQTQTYSVEASVVLGHGTRLHGHGEGEEMLAAVDQSEQRLQKQIRRFHARLKNHRDRSRIAQGERLPAEQEEETYEQVVREMLEEGEE